MIYAITQEISTEYGAVMASIVTSSTGGINATQ